ncbi:methylenetetrahydrofolate reductase [Demequina mangrovi]|uniref:Methylenetetrahydrofolate reductase n=1 Tax=Demequina mangrovi TaxID=1043493 RepID=A0A1H6Y7E1_9MICO|nr:methylenetetrahydrofolate reductase [Demequina mangrovi]SEJ35804.1 methylenetetrahydrofolate reductase (NADPH) [Demequina mangrovi]
MHRTATLLEDLSVEITARDTATLVAHAGDLPAGTRVSVTHLGTEGAPERREAAAAAARAELVPVPHLAARRLGSESELRDALDGLRAHDAHERLFVVGGDPRTPAGPYASALDVIRSGLLAEAGVAEVGITGYPEGHPAIADEALWAALRDKTAAIADQGLTASVTTQFSFDADAVVAWIERARALGIAAPIRVGVPGPAGVRRLVAFARRCGVGTSAGIARKYGFSLTSLVGTAGPDRFVEELTSRLEDAHGEVRLHLYTFGTLAATIDWARAAREAAVPAERP